jgi:hypothetical protein
LGTGVLRSHLAENNAILIMQGQHRIIADRDCD